MAEIQWWYARGDEQFGPVSAAELRRLASAGDLGPADLVWREGLSEWAPAARLKGLFADVPPAEAAAARTEAADPAPNAPAPSASEPAEYEQPATAHQVTAEMVPPPAIERAFGNFAPVEPALGAPPIQIPPAATPDSGAIAGLPAPAADRSRISYLRLARILTLVEVILWGTCVAVVLLGGLLLTLAHLRAKTPADEAASAAIFATFFIGAYVVARAGEKISQRVLHHFRSQRSD